MVNLIIKEMDMDVCGEHTLEDLGASGFYDLLRVRIHRFFFLIHFFYIYSNHHSFISGDGANEGPSGQVCGQRGGDLSIS